MIIKIDWSQIMKSDKKKQWSRPVLRKLSVYEARSFASTTYENSCTKTHTNNTSFEWHNNHIATEKCNLVHLQ